MADRRRQAQRAARAEAVRRIACILKTYETSPFQYEGACIHGVRSALCLRGWQWSAANDHARSLVHSALDRIGARRPSWDQGQPEYLQYGIVMVERTRCARCTRKLPDDRRIWCSDVCFMNAHKAKQRRHEGKSAVAARDAGRAAFEKTSWKLL
jgi:hypothetical protein